MTRNKAALPRCSGYSAKSNVSKHCMFSLADYESTMNVAALILGLFFGSCLLWAAVMW